MTNYADFKGYKAVVRSDDIDDPTIQKLRDAGLVIETLVAYDVCDMMRALGCLADDEAIWPKGTVYLVPPGSPLFPVPLMDA